VRKACPPQAETATDHATNEPTRTRCEDFMTRLLRGLNVERE
jgi:hypothetical protein